MNLSDKVITMIMTLKILFFFLLNLSLAQASDQISAYRHLNKDFTIYESKIDESLSSTPVKESRLYDEATLPKATAWVSLKAMQERFDEMRDIRFLNWNERPLVLRRISWNYPDDGCYARASLAMVNIFRWFLPLPNKVFAFGNLRVKTNNSPRGAVGWWYHVAPIVEVNGVKFVLDPAIERTKPLTLKEWLERMGTPEQIKVAICGSGSYSPGDNCDKESDGLELRAERAEETYLGREWYRMVSLGREAEL